MRQELLQVIPEIEEISDADLREQTIKCFLLACQQGGRRPRDMQEMAFTALVETEVTFADKLRCVYHICIRTAQAMEKYIKGAVPINMDVLKAGALLCDVAKMIEVTKTAEGKWGKTRQGKLVRHPFSGVGLAMQAGLPEEVQHIIAAHAGEGNLFPRTAEAIIVYHADFVVFDPFVKEKALQL